MANNKEIVPYTHPVREIVYSTPAAPSSATNKVITELKNSWNACGFLDDRWC